MIADPDTFKNAVSKRDKDGKLYDPRKGLGGYYRYGPRKLVPFLYPETTKQEDDEVGETLQQRTHCGQIRDSPHCLPQRDGARTPQLTPQSHPVTRRLSEGMAVRKSLNVRHGFRFPPSQRASTSCRASGAGPKLPRKSRAGCSGLAWY